jgi:hypothetical protein
MYVSPMWACLAHYLRTLDNAAAIARQGQVGEAARIITSHFTCTLLARFGQSQKETYISIFV